MKNKILFFRILSAIIGCFFVFSALVKLNPIEILEIAIVETGFSNWHLAPIFARLIIGAEFFMGLFLILNIRKKFFTVISGLSLIVFSFYLLILLIFQGNNVNCNCFGLFMVMNPLESILKNVVLIVLLIILYFKNKSIHFKAEKIVLIIGFAIATSLPFILNPISDKSSKYDMSLNQQFKMDFSIIYSNPEIEHPKVVLNKGKHLVGFFSSSCQHCIIAGYNLKVLSSQHPDWSIYFFINGDDDDLANFHTLTKSKSIPHSKLPGKELLAIAGNKLPALFLINNTIVEQRIMPDNLDETEIGKWFSIGAKNKKIF